MHHPIDMTVYTTIFVTLGVEHWLAVLGLELDSSSVNEECYVLSRIHTLKD